MLLGIGLMRQFDVGWFSFLISEHPHFLAPCRHCRERGVSATAARVVVGKGMVLKFRVSMFLKVLAAGVLEVSATMVLKVF